MPAFVVAHLAHKFEPEESERTEGSSFLTVVFYHTVSQLMGYPKCFESDPADLVPEGENSFAGGPDPRDSVRSVGQKSVDMPFSLFLKRDSRDSCFQLRSLHRLRSLSHLQPH